MKKITILYTIPNFNTAGSGKHLLSIIKKLDPNLFEQQIICRHDSGFFFNDVKKTGIKIHIIDYYIKPRPFMHMIKECHKLSKSFKKINPDIIHSYNYAADYTEPIAARMAGIKWVYTKKNMSWQGPSYRGWKFRSWLADGIMAQNSDMMRDFFPNYRKAELIPMGIDINEYKKQSPNNTVIIQWGITEQTRVIMSVANLVPVKGIEILIKAFENLHKKFNHWVLIIVGNDMTDYALKLKGYLSNKPYLENRIIFTGEQKNVRGLLNIAEIYVQPTLNIGRKEGGPISTLEAMANGKVIIGSNISGIRDQLLKQFPEHLFKAGDTAALESKLDKFMAHSKIKNQKIGDDFINFVKKEFDISIQKMKSELFYQNLIQQL